MSEKMYHCEPCNKYYTHKRSLDRHVKDKHIQCEITESQPEAEAEKDIKAFVYQFLDFWGCNLEQFPLYLPECIQILIKETRAVHNIQHETFRTMSIILTKYYSSEENVLLQLVDEMFKDEIFNWGRIIHLFTMAIELSEYGNKHNLPDIYYEIPDMLVYALKKADDWIRNQGGWNAFAVMYNKL